MATTYTINLTSGNTLVKLDDGLPDVTATSLTLFGKNYAGYGEPLNENLVRLLENFSFVSPPAHALQGQLWWDSNNKLLKIRREQDWKIVSGPSASPIAPIADTVGDLWWNTDTKQLNVYDGMSWDTVGPIYTASQGVCGPVVSSAVGSVDSVNHTIVKFEVGGEVIGVLSKDPAFNTNSVSGFVSLKPGFNLSPSHMYYGNSENALNLGGVLAGNFIRSDVDSSTSHKFSVQTNTGLNVGLNDDLTVDVQNNAVNLVSNTPGRDMDFYVNLAGISTLALRINGTNGQITVTSEPTVSAGIATKNYVDTVIATAGLQWLKADGSTPIIGNLYPLAANTFSLGTINDFFAEVHSSVFRGSNVITSVGEFNTVTINTVPTALTSATPKGYVDDLVQVARNDLTSNLQSSLVNLIGGAPSSLSTLATLATALNNNPTFGVDTLTLVNTKSPTNSPSFTGNPQSPTASVGDASSSIATTAFVNTAVNNKGTELVNILHAGYAPITNPQFLGSSVTAPTPADSDSSQRIATTAYVNSVANSKISASELLLTNTFNSTLATTYAPLANPHFTGSPTAVTPAATDNSTNLATTAFVTTAIANEDTLLRNTLGTTYAPLANPHFTGTPTAPTAALADRSTQIATTQHVTDKIIDAMTGASSTNNLRVNNPSFTGTLSAGTVAISTGLQVNSGGITTTTSDQLDIGSATNGFRNIYGKAMKANYADLAENYIADAQYEPGTVLIFGGPNEVTIANEQGSHKVAGVVSTNPAYLMNTGAEGEFIVAIALQGRCPVKVIGPVKQGDLLVSSSEGYARSKQQPMIGTVIGKALRDFDGLVGVIEVAVGRC